MSRYFSGQIFEKSTFFQIYHSDITLSSACFPYNSEESSMMLRFLDKISMTFNTPEGSGVTLIGKTA